MTDAIFDLAKTMGKVDQGDWETLRTLCQAALDRVTARLKTGVSEEDYGPAVTLAAAWLALADLAELGGGVESFSAGDLTIKGGRPDPDRLRRLGEAALTGWAEDGGFCFTGVGG